MLYAGGVAIFRATYDSSKYHVLGRYKGWEKVHEDVERDILNIGT